MFPSAAPASLIEVGGAWVSSDVEKSACSPKEGDEKRTRSARKTEQKNRNMQSWRNETERASIGMSNRMNWEGFGVEVGAVSA